MSDEHENEKTRNKLGLLTTKEVAALLGCSDTYLKRLRKRGEGPPLAPRYGKTLYYQESDVLHWFNQLKKAQAMQKMQEKQKTEKEKDQ